MDETFALCRGCARELPHRFRAVLTRLKISRRSPASCRDDTQRSQHSDINGSESKAHLSLERAATPGDQVFWAFSRQESRERIAAAITKADSSAIPTSILLRKCLHCELFDRPWHVDRREL
jgi:hypothetical protein